ncbi:7352_t:CDS:1 [Acaulospora morrowiae]|uniref:Nuclear pore complex protein Nup85 n=1 Tax=Acaulospora morrowiae TaxID=94023 RepID=A0A9N9A057_9GLOM|nr:7352_t:CDS:1 [Acaulospora morrowiae]
MSIPQQFNSDNQPPTAPFTFQADRVQTSDFDDITYSNFSLYNNVLKSRDSESYSAISSNGESFVEYRDSQNDAQLHYLDPPFMDGEINWSGTNQTLSAKFNPYSVDTLVCHMTRKVPTEEWKGEILHPDQQVYEFSFFDRNNSRAVFYNDSYLKIVKAAECDKEQKIPRIVTIINLCKVYWDYARLIEARVEKLKSQGKETLAELKTFQWILMIWELCGIIYINPKKEYYEELSHLGQNSYGRLSNELKNWSNKWLPLLVPLEDYDAQLEESISPQEEKVFWPYLRRLVLRGSSKAIDLLNLVSEKDIEDKFLKEYIDKITQILSSRPHFKSQDLEKFSVSFKTWRDKIRACEKELNNQQDEPSSENIISILKILRGDINSIIEESNSWIEALMSMAISHPLWDVQNLREKTRDCLLHFPMDENTKALDKVLASLLVRDPEQGIKLCEKIDVWLVAHLSDMFNKFELVGKIRFQGSQMQRRVNPYSSESDMDIRELSLLNFAESLVFHHSLWQLAFKYFELCEAYGKFYIAECIMRIPFDSEFKLSKILNICRSNRLDFQEKTILRVAGKRYLQEERYASSIKYFMDAGDTASLEVIFRIFLDYYTNTGNLGIFKYMESVQLDESSPDSMKFLSKYRLFHELMQVGDFQTARAYIMELICSQIAPTTFLPVLLVNTLPLFHEAKKSGTVILTNADNFEILRNLYNLVHGMYQEECASCLERMRVWHTYVNGYADINEKLSILWTAVNDNQLIVYKYGEESNPFWN